MLDSLDDDQQMLIDIEQNIANLEKSMALGRRGSWQSQEGDKGKSPSKVGFLKRTTSLSTPEKSPASEKKR